MDSTQIPQESCQETERNSESGIAVLHPEILLEIFMKLTDLQRPEWIEDSSPYTTSINPHPNQLEDPTHSSRNVTQVCKHWREIGINAPQLWNRFIDCDMLPPEWFQEVLHRSQDVPLIVVAAERTLPGFRYTDINLSFLLKTKKQFREFHGRFTSFYLTGTQTNALVDRMREPMPSLTTFSLHTSGQLEVAMRRTVTPFNLFAGSAPLLQKIEFIGSPWEVLSPLLPNLTHLSIGGRGYDVACVSLLRQTHYLQSLSMHFLPVPNPNEPGSSPTLQLPYLTHIQLKRDYSACTEFLASLNPAPLRTLTCELSSVTHHQQGGGLFLETLERLLPSEKPHNKLSCGTTTVFLARRRLSIHTVTNDDRFFSFCFLCDGFIRDAYFSFLMVASRPLFISSTNLTLDSRADLDELPSISDERFFVLFLPFINAQVIRFTAGTLPRTLEIINREDRPPYPVLFPALDKIILPCSIASQFGYFDEAVKFLRNRKEEGYPISTVSFQSVLGNHSHTASKRRARTLKKTFGVTVTFHTDE
ncbi:hypothetical protein BDZ97DRAFT_1916511 [Flammula alnicola]|nr:hypothetical protein BDZ97DRAFT_1916511 [Flammula alnicola]